MGLVVGLEDGEGLGVTDMLGKGVPDPGSCPGACSVTETAEFWCVGWEETEEEDLRDRGVDRGRGGQWDMGEPDGGELYRRWPGVCIGSGGRWGASVRFCVRTLCELQLFAALNPNDTSPPTLGTLVQTWRSLCSTAFFQGKDNSIGRETTYV